MKGIQLGLLIVSLSLVTAVGASGRTTSYTYTPEGLIETIDGPRTDVADITRYTYDTSGNRTTMTNALGQVTQYTDYDGAGRLQRMVDPNGVVTTYTYHPRGWLLSVAREGDGQAVLTTYEYDLAGNITRIVLSPLIVGMHGGAQESAFMFTYDDANRLTQIRDSEGNERSYTLDDMGNRLVETDSGTGMGNTRQLTRTFDTLNRLVTIQGDAFGRTIAYGYDDNGNTLSVTDGMNNVTQYQYDALDRISHALDMMMNETRYAYDAGDNLVAVTDPRGLVTTYTHNAFDELILQISPDTGVTTLDYDQAGNLTRHTDARNVTVDYTYDALNRLTGIRYPNPDLDVTFTYDLGAHAIGRLTHMVDAQGTTEYRYDQRGHVISATRTAGSLVFTTGYTYDDIGRLATMRYPSGLDVHYRHNSVGETTQMDLVLPDGQMMPLLHQIEWLPFGPVRAFHRFNGSMLARQYDGDHRLTGQIDGPASDEFTYDGADNIVSWSRTDTTNWESDHQSFNYDALHRLIIADGEYGNLSFSYDAVGNRLTKFAGPAMTDYVYGTDSNRLNEIHDDFYDVWTYDARGNLDSTPTGAFTYDDTNRLVAFHRPGLTVRYGYNGRGERVFKDNGTDVTHFVYADRRLIGEYTDTGIPIREYVYLADDPVAVITGPTATRQLNLVQRVSTDNTGTTVDLGDFTHTPVVIAGPLSHHDADPAVIRLDGVSRTAVEVALKEWRSTDGGTHAQEDFSLLALAAGRHPQADGRVWELGTFQASTDGTPASVSLAADGPPVMAVFLTLQSAHAASPVTTRLVSLHASGFDAALTSDDAWGQGTDETVGYLAIRGWDMGTGTLAIDGVPVTYEVKRVVSPQTDQWWSDFGWQFSPQRFWPAGVVPPPIPLAGHVDVLRIGQHVFSQVASFHSPGTLLSVRRLGAVSGEPLVDVVGGLPGDVYAAHTDHLGVVSRLTDITGTVVWSGKRLPFGTLETATDTVAMPLRFPGQYYDEESGLHYNYFRDYDPTTGRYIQSDPIGLAGGLNTYEYAKSNPLYWTDPLGLNPGAATRAFQGLAGMLSRMGRPTRPVAPPVIPPGGLPPGYDVPDIPAHTPIDPPIVPIPPIPMPNEGSGSSSGSSVEECEKECDLEWDRNKFLCDSMSGANHGFKSKAYKTCLERIDRIYIECVQDCAKACE